MLTVRYYERYQLGGGAQKKVKIHTQINVQGFIYFTKIITTGSKNEKALES